MGRAARRKREKQTGCHSVNPSPAMNRLLESKSTNIPLLNLEDMALLVCVVFEELDRPGPLVDLRKMSGAKNHLELRSYIAAAPLTTAERRALAADIEARAGTADEDFVRLSLRRFLLETGAGARLGLSDSDVHNFLD